LHFQETFEREFSQKNQSDPYDRVTIVSHRKDADGLCSAALLYGLAKAEKEVVLIDYNEMIEIISKLEPSKEVFICDLGLNRSTFDDFFREVKRLAVYGKVRYIDHHPLDPEFERELAGVVDLYHSVEESAAVLVYKKFESALSCDPKMKVLACCGAITDYMDLQPFARKLISSFDRQFLLYEAVMLSFSVAMIGLKGPEGNPMLEQIVRKLGKEGKLPHEIENAAYYAQEFATQSSELIEQARRHGIKMKNFGFFKSQASSTGNAANFLIGALDTPVGAVFREDGSDHYEVSVRSIHESKHDIGKIVGKISNELQASGGGHAHAAGSRIKRDQLNEFVEKLDRELSLSA
jgi:single-stranded DNA-specific DHH superfamily exonuclease